MSVPRVFRGLVVALQFLTRLPMPALDSYSEADQKSSAVWYPVVGLVIGAVLALTAWCGMLVTPWFGAFVTVVIWVWITGGLHLDGLADVTDGLGAAHGDPARFAAVAKEPHTGSFAVIALVLLLVGKVLLLADLGGVSPPSVWLPALVLIPAWARLGPLIWRIMVTPLGDGRGRAFSQDCAVGPPLVAGLALVAASLWFEPALLAGLGILPLIAFYWRHRLDGMSGDCHGASIEVSELALLGALVVAGG